MAALVITADDVDYSGSAKRYIAGEDLVEGEIVYLNSTKKVNKATPASAPASVAKGIVVSAGSDGQDVFVIEAGPVTLDPDEETELMVQGEVYVLLADGGIGTTADLAEDDYLTIVGYATSPGVLFINPVVTKVQHG